MSDTTSSPNKSPRLSLEELAADQARGSYWAVMSGQHRKPPLVSGGRSVSCGWDVHCDGAHPGYPASAQATEPGVDPCPQCGFTIGVRVLPGTSPNKRGWSCALCCTQWWIGAVLTPVTPRPLLDLLTAAVELGTMRAVLANLLALAERAPGLSDEQVRGALVSLGRSSRRLVGGGR